VDIINGELRRNETNQVAMGGTELIATKMVEHLDNGLLKNFQIIHSRVREVDDSKVKILVLHDLPGDPESEHLKNGGWNRFDKLVFVSNWQMQAYQKHYGLPWYKCDVIHNAIDPIDLVEKPTDKIKIIYHTTPHRGLNILLSAFNVLAKEYSNLELDVYSSFKIYGWEGRDEQYKPLFDYCKEHPQINYHGSVSNDEVRKALQQAHFFVYPSTWVETSCMSLMEAMSAGCFCIHPNYGALYETAANWTWMYQWVENERDHVKKIIELTSTAIESYNDPNLQSSLTAQKLYADTFYGWPNRTGQWNNYLRKVLYDVRGIDLNG
jgi:glycosyltransferase involved in cell wall biosynthesis